MSILTIQPNNADALLWNGGPDTNKSNLVTITLDAFVDTGAIQRDVLRFDFSSLPEGAVISAATVQMSYYGHGADDPVGKTVWIYEITQTGWVEAEVCWNHYAGTTHWATAGGDYTVINGASNTIPATHPNWISWDVLALVQHFQSVHSEVANFLLRWGDEAPAVDYIAQFRGRAYTTDLTLRPKLLITYTVPYILTAGAGSYSKAGQAAVLRAARKIPGDPGFYALTGQAVDLKLARKIPAAAGSYALTGQDAVLRAIRKMAASGGSYVYTGMDVNLAIGKHYILTAEAGSYGEPYSKIFVTLDGRIYKKTGDTYLRLS